VVQGSEKLLCPGLRGVVDALASVHVAVAAGWETGAVGLGMEAAAVVAFVRSVGRGLVWAPHATQEERLTRSGRRGVGNGQEVVSRLVRAVGWGSGGQACGT